MADMANRDEADKCKQIAQAALRSGDSEKAIRFLSKAKKMCPADSSIDALIEAAHNGGGGEERPRTSTSEEPSGFRQRSPTASSAGAPRPASTSAERLNKDGQKYTADQSKEVQRILRTKDYYEVLGIEKNSGKEVVNKAYKKLALKLHPDKNKAPGSEEAFKKVSKAVQCLSDDEKKRVYDQYGDEEHIPQQRRQQYQQDFVSPEDFFSAFFGGGFVHPAHQQRRHHDDQGGGEVQRASLLQMLPVMLLVLLTLASNFASRDSGSRFSFSASGAYQSERTSASIGVNYYVAKDFDDHYPDGTRVLADFEKQVEIYYVRNLHSECDYQEKVMYKKVMIAKRRSSQEELQKARNHPRPACKEIERVKKRHNDIYRQAVYMPY